MAEQDDTSKSMNPRRNQRKTSTASSTVAAPAEPDGAESAAGMPPLTLEEALENVRTLLLEVRGILHVLSDVLMYADDADATMHAEVAKAAEGWISDSAARLDLVQLRPLIDAIRQGGGGMPPPDDQTGSGSLGLYQVREPTLVYYAA